jgi:transcriptional regulator with XRE-family HTH domain
MLADVARGDSIGARLKPFIGQRKQAHIEAEAGVSGGYLSRILSGKFKNPDEDHVRSICRVVGADFDWVYFGRGRPVVRAAGSRWHTYALPRPAFGEEAAFALAAGFADDAVLDAAVVLLGEKIPTAEQAREAIIAARDGVERYRAMVPGFLGTSSLQPTTSLQLPAAKRGST